MTTLFPWAETVGPLGRLSQRVVNTLVGTPTTSEQRYTCTCGAPMKNTGARSYTEYRVERWECTEPDCYRSGTALIFDEDGESYGEGVLAGQVGS